MRHLCYESAHKDNYLAEFLSGLWPVVCILPLAAYADYAAHPQMQIFYWTLWKQLRPKDMESCEHESAQLTCSVGVQAPICCKMDRC